MELFDQLGGLLQQFGGGRATPEAAEQHFEQMAGSIPSDQMAGGLAEAFRSSDTPPFPSMLGSLFGNSGGSQQSSVVNMLMAAAGPLVLSRLMSGGGMPSLSGLLGGGGQVTAEQAAQIPPEEIRHLAEHVEKHDPSIIDKLSSVYAEHPTLIKTLGGGALMIALAKISASQKRQ